MKFECEISPLSSRKRKQSTTHTEAKEKEGRRVEAKNSFSLFFIPFKVLESITC